MFTVCFTFDVQVMHFIISTQSVAVGHRYLYGRNNVNLCVMACKYV